MATALKNFNTQQDAVTVFLDGVIPGTGASIEAYIRDTFGEGQFIYEKDTSIGGQELFDLLRNKFQSGEIIPMPNNRMIVCYYMELKALTEEWIQSFFRKAEELKLFVPLNSIFDQHYIICFRYSAGNIRDEGEQKKIDELLLRLGTEKPEISHQIYLLRTAGFATDFVSQEKAVVQLLHLLSRRDYYAALALKQKNAIRILDSADYYTARAENCNRIISEIDTWHDGATDPDMGSLIGRIRVILQGEAAKLQDVMRNFRKRASVYPVNVKNFQGNIFTGFHSTIGPNHPILREIRSDQMQRVRDEIVEKADFSSVSHTIREEYHYPDYRVLLDYLGNGKLKSASVDEMSANADEDTKVLFEKLYEKAENMVRESIPDFEKIWQKKTLQRTKSIKELTLAGRFSSLDDCLNRINDETKPPQIAGTFASELKTTALVCGEPANNWNTRAYELNGIREAFRYPGISPCEIFVLKESDLVNLDSPDAVNALKIIY